MNPQPHQKEIEGNSSGAASIQVIIEPNKLSASVRISWPDDSTPNTTVKNILDELKAKNVTFGIDKQAVDNIIATSEFDAKVKIASGISPQPGKDASVRYLFDSTKELRPKEDSDGRIDYKDINFIQTAEKGQALVEKSPPTDGIPGTNVHGESVSAPMGKDVKLPTGTNTQVSDDGLQVIANVDGSIVTAGKKININEVQTIGGVNTTTGNITHNGSLIIRGNVEANFEVVVKGDVEIHKNVSDSKILSGGNIMVKGGFLGSQNGLLQSKGDIHCKYVNDQIIKADQNVYIGGEVFNSLITAGEQVHVTSSKGRIVGGKIQAKDEIIATCLGSDAGARTELQVAYDPKLMKSYHEIKTELQQMEENLERVDEGLVVFYRLQMDGKLDGQKEVALKKLEDYKKNSPSRQVQLKKKKREVEKEIQQNQMARIIAIKEVNPGVIVHFGIIYREITDKMGPSYFSLQGNTIVHEEYRPS